MARMTFAAALVDALHISLREDPNLSLIGAHILGIGPQRKLMTRITEDFSERVFDPPIAEAALAALGAGAAMAGARTFVDFTVAAFSYCAWSQLVNEAAVAHYMSNGQIKVPVVYHMLHGVRGGGGPQHSHSPQAMLWNAPGLEIITPSTPSDVKGLIRTAIRSDNPTVIVNHSKLLAVEGEVPEGDYMIPFGVADIKRKGRDVTVVATSFMVQEALKAAVSLADEGIEVEIVDPRTLAPLDENSILDSVARTGRLVVADECPLRCGVASEITATVAEKGFSLLKAPPIRVARADTPVPLNPLLEAAVTPDHKKIADAVRRVLKSVQL
jgi:acetoin:2,6-dichlorophenolindophenol oxidoreductase subunit beta